MFEVTFENGKKPLIKTNHHVEVEETSRGIYYLLVNCLGREDAIIKVRDNKISWVYGNNNNLRKIFEVYPELLKLEVKLED